MHTERDAGAHTGGPIVLKPTSEKSLSYEPTRLLTVVPTQASNEEAQHRRAWSQR
jgi:hypothetical protein